MLAILSNTAPKPLSLALISRGYQVLSLPSHPHLPTHLSSHPDLLLFFAEDAILTAKSYQKIAAYELETISKAAQKPIYTIDMELGDRYPDDVPLNAVRIGKMLIANPKAVAPEILSGVHTLCAVKQGYTKCSILPIGKNALITADRGIASASRSAGADVLQIASAGILLPGYNTGFIGGAGSFAPYHDSREILFCGALELHPQGECIAQFCRERNKEPISLTQDPLTDVGTLFLI